MTRLLLLWLQDPVFEKFLDSADPNEAAAAEAIALLNNIEELAAEVDEYNEAAFPQDAILQVGLCVRQGCHSQHVTTAARLLSCGLTAG